MIYECEAQLLIQVIGLRVLKSFRNRQSSTKKFHKAPLWGGWGVQRHDSGIKFFRDQCYNNSIEKRIQIKLK